ncbi:MAG: CsgG/HfaB family protein [Pseudomonadota bacterium]
MPRLFLALLIFLLALPLRADDTLVLWDFDNNTVGPMDAIVAVDPLARILPEVMLSRLSRVPGLRVVERVRLREILEEQKLGASEVADQDARLKLGRILGARAMVFGEYLALGPVVRADVRLVDVSTSQILLSEGITGTEEELVAEIQDLAGRIAARQGRHAASQGGAGFPPEAWQTYEAGLRQMDDKQFDTAIDTFKQLLAQHPGFSPAERQIGLALERLARKQ